MKKIILLSAFVLLSLICIFPSYANPLSADVWINDDDGKGLYHRAGTYEIGDNPYTSFQVDEDCTVQLTVTKPNGKKNQWGPYRISAGTYHVPGTVADPPGEAKLVIEAWTDTEYARDLLLYEVVNTIPQGFTADVWTTICGKGVYNPENPQYYGPYGDDCDYYPGDAIILLYSVNEPATIKLTIIKPDESQLVFGPKDVPAGPRGMAFVAGEPGIRTVIFEAWPEEGPKAEDRLYLNVSYSNSAHQGAVTGNITDASTRSELNHVRVWFPENPIVETIVYSNGFYFLEHPSGPFRISAHREKYHQRNESVIVPNIGLERQDFALSPIGTPQPPASINATRGDFEDRIRITWSDVSAAMSYKLYFAMSATGSKELLEENIGSTEYDHLSAEAYTDYYYWVKSSYLGDDSDTFTGPTWGYRAPPLPPPASVRISEKNINKIHIEWDPVPGAASYLIFSSTSSDGPPVFIHETTDPFYNHYDVEENTLYYYWIKSKYRDVQSASFSSPVFGRVVFSDITVLPQVLMLLLEDEKME